MSPRTGIGYDIHRLVENRKLILGGVEIEHSQGLTGHSDADVLTHAVCDALLGAAGLGDLGRYFPSSEEKFKGISSLELLRRVVALVSRKGFHIINIDTTLIAEAPRLSPHLEEIKKRLAEALGLSTDRVNVKVKSHEGLDSIGRGEAIAAQAITLIEE
ncbi:MAG: 2-C-methyl-D-erythritol 2,4-cyclodiphosphate synthase [Acidobacteriia bacterium]|nr:2-C-methyl-D-erythritol 2,4-cyclodiphosphate synthase [Terriglobia bacterium]